MSLTTVRLLRNVEKSPPNDQVVGSALIEWLRVMKPRKSPCKSSESRVAVIIVLTLKMSDIVTKLGRIFLNIACKHWKSELRKLESRQHWDEGRAYGRGGHRRYIASYKMIPLPCPAEDLAPCLLLSLLTGTLEFVTTCPIPICNRITLRTATVPPAVGT